MQMKQYEGKRNVGQAKGSRVLHLSTEVKAPLRGRLDELEAFQAPYLEQNLISKGVFTDSREFQEAFGEFKRFVALSMIHGQSIGMMSEKVDALWHQFILFTHEYMSFCDTYLGRYLHHVPCGEGTDVSAEAKAECDANFVRLYTQTFGEIPRMQDSCCNGTGCGEIRRNSIPSNGCTGGDGGPDDSSCSTDV
jgi:hypothetical protein